MGQNAVAKTEQTLANRIREMLENARYQGQKPAFTGFLSLREQSVVKQTLGQRVLENTLFFGGHPAGERVVFGVFPYDDEPRQSDFPILALRFLFRPQDSLSHRDFLGAILALGLSRGTVGDILVEDGSAVGFLSPTAAKLVQQQLTCVGRTGVAVIPYAGDALPEVRLREMVANVASRRLDCLTAALWKLSRENSAAMIRSGLVSLDGMPVLRPDMTVPEASILSLRGKGRFWVGDCLGSTKKDRLKLRCKQYL